MSIQFLNSSWQKSLRSNPNHYIITLIKFKMSAVQINIRFIMCITFLNFPSDLFMHIKNMWWKCRCRLGYLRMMHHRDKIYRLLRFITMHNFKWTHTYCLIHRTIICKLRSGKIRFPFLKFSPTKQPKRFPRLLLTISVWLSIWRWKAIESFSLVPILCVIRSFKNSSWISHLYMTQ